MLNKILVAKAAERLKNPTMRTPGRERMLFASMAAESLKLEGINTSTEDVLAAVDSTEIAPASPRSSVATMSSSSRPRR